MPITSVSNSALLGIQRGLEGIRRNATEIASHRQAASSSQFPTKDLIRAMVELHQNKHDPSAAMATFKTADQMIGSLLDIKA